MGDAKPHDRVARGMARGAQGASGKGKGIHAAARPAERRAARDAVGEGGQALRVREAGGQGDAGRPLRRPAPADRVPLHVRPGVGGRVPELLLPVRPYRRRRRAPRAARRDAAGGVASASPADRSVQEAHGLALPVGVVARDRLQLRLSRVVQEGRDGEGRRGLQLRPARIPERGGPRPERLLQGRARRGLPHVFQLRARTRPVGRRVQLPRPGPEGPRRRRPGLHDGVGPPPRSVRRRSGLGKESGMSGVRLLVGTRKGAFVMTSDGTRERWDVTGPHFGGWEIYHLKGSPADPNRLYASQSSSWFGQVIQRSNDRGQTLETVGNKFVYDGPTGTHLWYDGTPHPWEFKRVWHFEPSLSDPNMVYAGIEDAAIFQTTDGGATWNELPGLRGHGSGPKWQPGAGGMCLHTIILDPANPKRMYIAISAAGAFRSDDGGKMWKPINRGLHSQYIPDPDAEVGHCVHRIALHPSCPNTLFMQKHWDVMRRDDAGGSWHEVRGNLRSGFGFAS